MKWIGAIGSLLWLARPMVAQASTDDTWYLVESPTKGNLAHVRFAEDGTGYAVGENGTVLRYDGVVWQSLPFPEPHLRLAIVAPIGMNEAWVVPSASNTIYHYFQGSWSNFHLDRELVVMDMDFLRPDLGYLAGLFGMLYRYNGDGFERIVTSAITTDRESHLRGVAVFAEDDVWVGSDQFLLHYDGRSWTRDPLPKGTTGGPLQREGKELFLKGPPLQARRENRWETISEHTTSSVSISPRGEIWAVGTVSSLGTSLLRVQPKEASYGVAGRLVQAVARGADALWAVGAGGMILRLEPRLLPSFVDQTFEAGAGVQALSRFALLVDLDGMGPRDLLLAMPFGRNSFLRAEEGHSFRSQPLAAPQLSDLPDATSIVVTDMDGDGWNDLVLRPDGKPGHRPIHLFRGLGGFRFWDSASSLAPLKPEDTSSVGDLAVADLDSDGDLDIYEAATEMQGVGMPLMNRIYRNDGFGHLAEEKLAEHAGGAAWSWSRSALVSDFTGDGRTDLVSLNSWGTGSSFYRQDERGALVDATRESGIAGAVHQARGGAVGDVDGDGALDILTLNTQSFGPSRLYRNDGFGHFRDITTESGLDRLFVAAEQGELVDMDLDGDLDLVLANAFAPGEDAAAQGKLRLFMNDGEAHFSDATVKAGVDKYASSFVADDFDEDGDVDLYLIRSGESNQLLLNQPPGFGFLKVRLESPAPNRQAIGARISFYGPDGQLVGFRETSAQKPIAHLGLLDLPWVTVEVCFPSGRVVRKERVLSGTEELVVEVSRPELWARNAIFLIQHRAAWADGRREVFVVLVVVSFLFGLWRLSAWLGAKYLLRRPSVIACFFLIFTLAKLAYLPLEPVSMLARSFPFVLLFGAGILLLGLDLWWTRRAQARYVGAYELLSELGQGGMGIVYRARDTSQPTRPIVALKVLKPERVRDATSMRRFVREADIGARISHPGIVATLASGQCRVLDGGVWRETAYLAMECVEGASLATLLSGADRLPLVRVLEILRDTASALSVAHAAGVLHRDIKPDNILLSRAGVVKIADFGIAAIFSAPSQTEAGFLVGTLAYLPPERALGRREDERGDLYSLGAVLYEAVCGRWPFDTAASSSAALLRAIVNDRPTDPRELREDIPQRLCDIIGALLEKDPALRPANAQAVAEALEDVLRELRGELVPIATKEAAPTPTERALANTNATDAPFTETVPEIAKKDVDPYERETLDLPQST